MTPQQMAALHARCFTRPRPWSADEFASLLASDHVFLLSDPNGFLMGRAIAGEAELLTLAVAPEARRLGVGSRLTGQFADTARQRGADEAFLEVASDNIAAQALYARMGWQQAGTRPGYYGDRIDALTLRLAL